MGIEEDFKRRLTKAFLEALQATKISLERADGRAIARNQDEPLEHNHKIGIWCEHVRRYLQSNSINLTSHMDLTKSYSWEDIGILRTGHPYNVYKKELVKDCLMEALHDNSPIGVAKDLNRQLEELLKS